VSGVAENNFWKHLENWEARPAPHGVLFSFVRDVTDSGFPPIVPVAGVELQGSSFIVLFAG
jgi:hypothetical protein